MKGLLFATVLLSSAALLTSGDLDVVTGIRREASSRSRGNVRVEEDDSGGSPRSLVDESIALPILIGARGSGQNGGRSQHDPTLVIVSNARDPFEKRDPVTMYNSELRGDRLVMENPMYIEEPGFMDISRNDKKTEGNSIGPFEYPIIKGKRTASRWSTSIEKPKQDDRRIRMRTRRDFSNAKAINDRTFARRYKHSTDLWDYLSKHYFIVHGKRSNYQVNDEKLFGRRVPWNYDDSDDDWTFAKSLESKKQDDNQWNWWNQLSAAKAYYPHKGKRPTVVESTESV